jgi:hypothetical protein
MRPKARELAQHGGPPGWLEMSDPAGCDFLREGPFMPSALTDHTTCPGLGLIYSITKCEQNTVLSYITQGRQVK